MIAAVERSPSDVDKRNRQCTNFEKHDPHFRGESRELENTIGELIFKRRGFQRPNFRVDMRSRRNRPGLDLVGDCLRHPRRVNRVRHALREPRSLASIRLWSRAGRNFLMVASSSLAAAVARPAISAESLKELRVGYQRIGGLLTVKEQKVLEQHFESQGVRVRWIEFAFGPPLLETLGTGAIDYGFTGDAPPIFAQAAHANPPDAGAIPARGYGQAIVVPATSSIQGIAGLVGKKVAVEGVERPQPAGRRARRATNRSSLQQRMTPPGRKPSRKGAE